jgi:hypothetical protein
MYFGFDVAKDARDIVASPGRSALNCGNSRFCAGFDPADRASSRVHNRNIHSKERGCTKPRCDAPAYSRVHHVQGWTNTHRTDINDLTLACGPHNRLAEKGWTTRKNAKGETEWIPPPHLDYGQPRINTYHHPEKLLAPDDDEPD